MSPRPRDGAAEADDPGAASPQELSKGNPQRDDPTRTSAVFERVARSKASAPQGVVSKKKRAAKIRRIVGRALLLVPAAFVFTSDFTRRAPRLAHFAPKDVTFYAFGVLLSATFWGGLVVVASKRKGYSRVVALAMIALLALVLVGAQLYTHDRYSAYLDHRAVLVGTQMLPSVGQQLWFDRSTVLRALLPSLAVMLALPLLLRRFSPSRADMTGIALDTTLLALLFSLFVSPDRGAAQGTSPDVMYLSAMGQLARARWDHNETVERLHPGPRTPIELPALTATPARPRNVLFLVTESVRAQSVCLDYTKNCPWTPEANAALPERMALTQMRALDSTTAISIAIMWGGLPPTAKRDDFHRVPLLWEYAHAANIDAAYWTSQNLLFGNSGAWLGKLPVSHQVGATQLEANATYETGADDGKLVDYVLNDLDGMKEPYFGVVHFSNTHFPYKVDPKLSPFQPEAEATGPGYESHILNRYRDSIYLQDIAVGRLLRGIRARPESARTVIVFVSDHGEQMREKGAVGHTGTLFDPEVRIPFWVDAPEGTLTESERSSLTGLHETPVTSIDVFPTMLDLMGLHDEPKLEAFRKKTPGTSLLRGGSPTDRAQAMSNCTEIWACAFKNWGAIRGSKKLIAHQGDHQWNCYDTAKDPEELVPLDHGECADILPLAESQGGRPFR